MEFNDKVLEERIRDGRLGDVLQVLPRERWAQFRWIDAAVVNDENAAYVAHLVAAGASLEGSVVNGPVNLLVHATPLNAEVLCGLASSRVLHGALKAWSAFDHRQTRMFMKHGARLANVVGLKECARVPLSLWLFENALLRCRSAAVALIRVKSTSKIDCQWDRLLLTHIARIVWASRCEDGWMTNQDRSVLEETDRLKREEHDLALRERAIKERKAELHMAAIESVRPHFFDANKLRDWW